MVGCGSGGHEFAFCVILLLWFSSMWLEVYGCSSSFTTEPRSRGAVGGFQCMRMMVLGSAVVEQAYVVGFDGGFLWSLYLQKRMARKEWGTKRMKCESVRRVFRGFLFVDSSAISPFLFWSSLLLWLSQNVLPTIGFSCGLLFWLRFERFIEDLWIFFLLLLLVEKSW